jgi:hypothetical protein
MYPQKKNVCVFLLWSQAFGENHHEIFETQCLADFSLRDGAVVRSRHAELMQKKKSSRI